MEDQNMLPRLRTSNLLDEFFGNNTEPASYNSSRFYNTPAVNIVEEKEAFKIDIAAPGIDKNDFEIELENYVLTISSKREEKNEESNTRFSLREFNYASFKRSFTLPKTVKTDKIKASHKDGILTVSIPKMEEAIEKPARQIAIS
jgi:HSP20 family protein